MKRLILYCLLFISPVLWARSAVELTLNGGYSAFMKSEPEWHPSGFVGYGAHIGYAYFFNRYVGLGIGVDGYCYNGRFDRTSTETQDLIDSDNEPYSGTFDYSYRQKKSVWMLKPGISIFGEVPLKSLSIYMAIGAQYGISVSAQERTSYTVTHTGYYPKWHMTVTDIPEYGFTTTQISQPTEPIRVPYSWIIAARAGVAIPLKTGWSVLAGVNADYGITGDQPLSVNLELGVRCMFGLPKRHHCNCYQD